MYRLVLGFMLLLSSVGLVQAGSVEIVAAVFTHSGKSWRVSTTLRHADTGWEHYADAWRVVTADGRVLATRVLYHPHEHEQPFTRSLEDVHIPADTHVVYVEAHCKVHGWSRQRLQVDLRQRRGTRFQVQR